MNTMKNIIYSSFDFNLVDAPYSNNTEYLEDWKRFLDIKIYFYLHYVQKITESSESKLDRYKGLAIGKEEIIRLLQDIGQDDHQLIDLEQQDVQEYIEYLPLMEAYLEHRKNITIKKGVFLPFGYLIHVFRLNEFEQHCVMLSLLNHLDRRYERAFGYLQDDVTIKNPTSDLAIKLFAPLSIGVDVMNFVFALEEKLYKYFFYDINQPASSLGKSLILDKRMLDFIFDYKTDQEKINSYISIYYPGGELQPLLTNQQEQASLSKAFKESEGNSLIILHGPRGSGKKLQIKTLANNLKIGIVFIPVRALIKPDYSVERLSLHRAIREVLLHQGILCLTDFDGVTQDKIKLEQALLDLLADLRDQVNKVVIISREGWHPKNSITGYSWYSVELAIPTRIERSSIWHQLSQNDQLSASIDLDELANKFQFTPGQIYHSLQEARQVAWWKEEGEISPSILYNACYKQITHSLNEKASLVFAKYSLEDLVLPQEQKQYIINACNHIRYRHIVFEQWGFEEKLPYGKGVSMLFGGPPGTGKTMAAQVIAHELGLEMYKIDLSQVVSKYIGETEKNLKEVFDEAQKSNAILFFDECDSIFGKRTEVKDSHDKYANIETSFLLQKVEEFEGVSIMATNFMANIDVAFLRRISYVLHFPFPDPQSRELIWRQIFPSKTPLGEDVDFKFLAQQFELAGGNIKNIAVNAAFLAAAEKKQVGMRHLLLAVKDELTKQGKNVVSRDFGEYGFYLR